MLPKLQYLPELYLGESIPAGKLDRIKHKLEKHPIRAGVYLIVTAPNGVDPLEIYSAKLLAWPYYRKHPPFVVGIAGSYEEAVGIIEKMVLECWRTRGDCALKEYLLC